jgi:hypothetical protein
MLSVSSLIPQEYENTFISLGSKSTPPPPAALGFPLEASSKKRLCLYKEFFHNVKDEESILISHWVVEGTRVVINFKDLGRRLDIQSSLVEVNTPLFVGRCREERKSPNIALAFATT